MSISGKISVGVVTIAEIPSNRIARPITTKVYGRRSASRTIHMRPGPPFPMLMLGNRRAIRRWIACQWTDEVFEPFGQKARSLARMALRQRGIVHERRRAL